MLYTERSINASHSGYKILQTKHFGIFKQAQTNKIKNKSKKVKVKNKRKETATYNMTQK